MHIVLLNDDFPMEGGSSVAHLVKKHAEMLRAQNHRVTIVSTHRRKDSKTALTGEGGTLVSIPVSYRPSLRHYLSLYNPPVSKMLKGVFDRLQPDVIHAHNIHQYLTYDALRLAHQYTDKVFLTCHDAMAVAYGRVPATKKLTILDHVRQAGLQYNPLRNWRIRSTINNHVRGITAVSSSLASILKMNGLPNVQPIHNGIDVDYWSASAKQGQNFLDQYQLTGKKIILFSGRLRREKGIVQLVRALPHIVERVPNAILVVVGEQDRWNGLFAEADVDASVRQHCRCTGWLSHKQLADAYAACHVVATPSVYPDPFVLVNLEAMANSKPVVGTCFGGTPEIVVDTVTGFIRNPLHTNEYAEAITTLLQDDDLAQKMGAAGRQRAEEHFRLEHMTDAYLRLYHS